MYRASSAEIKPVHRRSAAAMSSAQQVRFLDELLAQTNLRAQIAFRGLLCERWSIGDIQQGRLGFHAVLSGRSWVRLPDLSQPVEVAAGALLIYRPGTPHWLTDTALGESAPSPVRGDAASRTEAGRSIELLCGYFEGGGTHIPIVEALPPYLLWRRFEDLPAPLERLMRTLAVCALDEARGVESILQRLCELMIHMILREPGILQLERVGILRAQFDPLLRRAFSAIHARPGRQWTLAALARSAGISRSAFAARFKQQTQVSAMHYLRSFRVALAERRMREKGISIDQAARAVGYRSAGAFRRAARRQSLRAGDVAARPERRSE